MDISEIKRRAMMGQINAIERLVKHADALEHTLATCVLGTDDPARIKAAALVLVGMAAERGHAVTIIGGGVTIETVRRAG